MSNFGLVIAKFNFTKSFGYSFEDALNWSKGVAFM
jgi:hypothetical protein